MNVLRLSLGADLAKRQAACSIAGIGKSARMFAFNFLTISRHFSESANAWKLNTTSVSFMRIIPNPRAELFYRDPGISADILIVPCVQLTFDSFWTYMCSSVNIQSSISSSAAASFMP